MNFDPLDDKIKTDWADKGRQALLDGQMNAGLRGAELMSRVEPYRPLADAVKAKIVAAMAARYPRRLDPPRERYGPGFRRVLDAMQAHAHSRFNRSPLGDPMPGDRVFDAGRPGVVISGDRPPDPHDRSPVNFHPSTGALCPPFWEDPPDPRFRPFPIELPGCVWPDGGESDAFPANRALADLGRVRWAKGRPTLWLPTPDSPEPE